MAKRKQTCIEIYNINKLSKNQLTILGSYNSYKSPHREEEQGNRSHTVSKPSSCDIPPTCSFGRGGGHYVYTPSDGLHSKILPRVEWETILLDLEKGGLLRMKV